MLDPGLVARARRWGLLFPVSLSGVIKMSRFKDWQDEAPGRAQL